MSDGVLAAIYVGTALGVFMGIAFIYTMMQGIKRPFRRAALFILDFVKDQVHNQSPSAMYYPERGQSTTKLPVPDDGRVYIPAIIKPEVVEALRAAHPDVYIHHLGEGEEAPERQQRPGWQQQYGGMAVLDEPPKTAVTTSPYEWLRTLLAELTTQIPPGKARHNITLRDDGELVLTVMRDGMWHEFVLDADDFRTNPAELVETISRFGPLDASTKLVEERPSAKEKENAGNN